MSSPKISRSQSREIALQVLFCEQFHDQDFARAIAGVQLSSTSEAMQQARGQLRELRKSLDRAVDALNSAEEGLAKLLATGERPIAPAATPKTPDSPWESLVHAEERREEAIEAVRDVTQKLRVTSAVFDKEGFAMKLLRTYYRQRERVNSVLERALEGWSLRRLTAEDGAALRLGVTELLFLHDVPPATVINEYIELAKRFGDSDAPKLVNGVLDRVARDNPRRAETPAET